MNKYCIYLRCKTWWFVMCIFFFWLCWVFVSVRGLSLVVASGGHSSSRCAGLSLSRPLLLQSTGFWRAGSVIVAHGCSCSVACGIFPNQGSNPCPLHWQADSQPLHHQGSLLCVVFRFHIKVRLYSVYLSVCGLFYLAWCHLGSTTSQMTRFPSFMAELYSIEYM